MLDVQELSTQERPIPAVKGWPLLGSLRSFQKDRLAFLLKVARECGDLGVFRLGPAQVMLANSAQLAHGILVEKAARFDSGRRTDIIKPIIGDNSLLVIDGAYHRKQRRLISPTFQHKRIIGYTKAMVDSAEAAQRSWREGATFDLEHEMTHLAQRIILKTLFDREAEATADSFDEFTRALVIVFAYVEHLNGALLPLPLSVPTLRNLRTRAAIGLMRRFVEQLVEERRREGRDHGDFLSMMMLSRDEDGSALKDDQILDHALTLYAAGHETSAKILTWLFIMLAQHPETAAKVRAEVDTALQGRRPSHEDLIRLPYSLQVIKETLRLFPPAYVLARAPIEDVELGAYRLRKGDYVLVSPFTVHRDPRYYPDPERFNPDRFLPENERRIPRGAFFPFGAGPHVCIGAQFAMTEIHMVLAHLVQHVTLTLAPGQDIRPLPMGVIKPSSSQVVVQRRTPA